jgi:hypothetical protein
VNLHAIAGPIVAVVNPSITCSILRSTGYTTSSEGERVATYAAPVVVSGQVQALSGTELGLTNGLTMQGIKRAIYLDGTISGVDRAAGTGGDLITFDGGADVPLELQNTIWLVELVLEQWDAPQWCKVAVVKQNA